MSTGKGRGRHRRVGRQERASAERAAVGRCRQQCDDVEEVVEVEEEAVEDSQGVDTGEIDRSRTGSKLLAGVAAGWLFFLDSFLAGCKERRDWRARRNRGLVGVKAGVRTMGQLRDAEAATVEESEGRRWGEVRGRCGRDAKGQKGEVTRSRRAMGSGGRW